MSKPFIFDRGSLITFNGPMRTAVPPFIPEEVGRHYTYPPENSKIKTLCHMGDHKHGQVAYCTIIPNKFPLCYEHYLRMYDGIETLLRNHYHNEPFRDWY